MNSGKTITCIFISCCFKKPKQNEDNFWDVAIAVGIRTRESQVTSEWTSPSLAVLRAQEIRLAAPHPHAGHGFLPFPWETLVPFAVFGKERRKLSIRVPLRGCRWGARTASCSLRSLGILPVSGGWVCVSCFSGTPGTFCFSLWGIQKEPELIFPEGLFFSMHHK